MFKGMYEIRQGTSTNVEEMQEKVEKEGLEEENMRRR